MITLSIVASLKLSLMMSHLEGVLSAAFFISTAFHRVRQLIPKQECLFPAQNEANAKLRDNFYDKAVKPEVGEI